jgi:hypothetical protein
VRKALPLALVAVVAGGALAPALAAPAKPKPITESYAVEGVPAPLPLVGGTPVETDSSCMDPALEGVSTTTRTIKPTGPGTLQVTLTGFAGDWDITLLDAKGAVVAEGAGTVTGDPSSLGTDNTDKLVAKIKKAQELRIAVCNFAGGPTAQASFTYTYK